MVDTKFRREHKWQDLEGSQEPTFPPQPEGQSCVYMEVDSEELPKVRHHDGCICPYDTHYSHEETVRNLESLHQVKSVIATMSSDITMTLGDTMIGSRKNSF